MMDKIRVDLRLRPIRFGFITRPDDGAKLKQIFQINTCLWGGKFNSIIPFFKRVPQWWDRHGPRGENATEIVNGYLDYFEPDFVVESEKGLASGLGINDKRVLRLSDVLMKEDDHDQAGYGLSVFDLYRDLYEKEFQFVQRHKPRFVMGKVKDRAYAAFAACLGGGFPSQQNLRYFERGFREAFEAEDYVIEASSLAKLYRSGRSSALRLGHWNLEVNFHDYHDPTLFVLDATEPRDLVDFWNYRSIHREVLAFPVQWLNEMAEFGREVIRREYRPLPGNPNGVMITPRVMFSRSIPAEKGEELYLKHFKAENPESVSLQTWYPPIWRPTPDYIARVARPTIELESRHVDLPVDVENPDLQFETISPRFAERYANRLRWANVIRLRDWTHKDRLATIFPTDFRSPKMPQFGLHEEHPLPTSEGLVIFPKFKDQTEYWRLSEGHEAIAQWLEQMKIPSRLSESGRATQQIIQTVGGFFGVNHLSVHGIIELLNEMSRRPITRSAHQNEFEQKVGKAIGSGLWRQRAFESLVERKVVELGYELKCPKCGSWSWYRLTQMNPTMTCDLCLRSFDFPATAPAKSSHARWAYRVIGPFALPDYAKGGYAAALAIRFFGAFLAEAIRPRRHGPQAWSFSCLTD